MTDQRTKADREAELDAFFANADDVLNWEPDPYDDVDVMYARVPEDDAELDLAPVGDSYYMQRDASATFGTWLPCNCVYCRTTTQWSPPPNVPYFAPRWLFDEAPANLEWISAREIVVTFTDVSEALREMMTQFALSMQRTAYQFRGIMDEWGRPLSQQDQVRALVADYCAPPTIPVDWHPPSTPAIPVACAVLMTAPMIKPIINLERNSGPQGRTGLDGRRTRRPRR